MPQQEPKRQPDQSFAERAIGIAYVLSAALEFWQVSGTRSTFQNWALLQYWSWPIWLFALWWLQSCWPSASYTRATKLLLFVWLGLLPLLVILTAFSLGRT